MARARQTNGEAKPAEKKQAESKPAKKSSAAVDKKKPAPRKRKRKPASQHEKTGRLTAVQKVTRDAGVVADRCSGMTWPEIAVKYGMSERNANYVYAAWRDGAMEMFAEEDALGIAFDFAARFESIESQFASLAKKADNDSARVGALRALAETTMKRMELLQATGKLPRDLGKLKVEIDVRHVAQVLVAVMEEYDMPVEAQEKVRAALRGGTPALASGANGTH